MQYKIEKGADDRKAYLIRHYARGRVINIGSGGLYITGATNLDLSPNARADVRADFLKMPFPDQSFESAFSFDIIEHTEKPAELIKETVRVLVPGGNATFTCVDFDRHPQNWTGDPTHVTYFNWPTFKSFFESHGFRTFRLYNGVMVACLHAKPFDYFLSLPFGFIWRIKRSLQK